MGPVQRPASEGGQLVRPLTHEERVVLAEESDDLLDRFLSGKASRTESCVVVRNLLHLRSRSLARKAR